MRYPSEHPLRYAGVGRGDRGKERIVSYVHSGTRKSRQQGGSGRAPCPTAQSRMLQALNPKRSPSRVLEGFAADSMLFTFTHNAVQYRSCCRGTCFVRKKRAAGPAQLERNFRRLQRFTNKRFQRARRRASARRERVCFTDDLPRLYPPVESSIEDGIEGSVTQVRELARCNNLNLMARRCYPWKR